MTNKTLASEEWWEDYQSVVNSDPEMELHGRNAFDENFLLGIGEEHFLIDVHDGEVQDVRTPGLDDAWSFGVVGRREAWEEFVSEVPSPHHNEVFASFYRTAVKGEEGYFDLIGNHKKIFQNFRSFQRALDLMRTTHNGGEPRTEGTTRPSEMTDEPIIGQYVTVDLDGVDHRIYYEAAGPEDGIPLLCQHTAGCNNQQWRHVLNDSDITENFRVIAYDLPRHGKSVPPSSESWWADQYDLTAEQFTDTIVSIADALELEDPVFIGSSMGGTITLELADWYPDRFCALIGLEAGLFTPGFYIQWLDHPHVNTNDVNSHATWGLMAPHGPEWARRETLYLYEQGANGVLKGDLHYYSVEHDYSESADDIDATQVRMYLMNGEYDYLTNPDDAREAAAAIGDGATAHEMKATGHFPMSERPELFRAYLKPVLDDIRGVRDEPVPEVLTPEDFDIEANK
ncbi:alpha/beta fold hydrolase [Natronorubrum aibiense]|uniref:Alpha/beta fold hydrolase n=1 Tax=Natronorubrum aibiense TaxID=348826 RepID=A0A5P9P858_9EURY|nr:alpha/beta hydrolase [Natronorubrum aibiense]QFU84324.1 alpha/beta fold hydrolase [Natronorubrum aibiense]